jgi:aromatic ring-opening dioxygenase LigB subunit
MGAYLLDQAGYHGARLIWSVSADEPVTGCRKLGADLAGGDTRTALLAIGDGSARRGLRAPGHFDARAGAFDAEVERALRSGDLSALLDVDPALARELMATGRPAWQVLAGALEERAGLATEVLYAGDPFGVAYLVATLSVG